MRRGLGGLAAMLLSAALFAEEETVSDTEVWNEGVGYYEKGDVTNALRVLKALVTPRSEYCARAAEVVAKLEYERGDFEAATRDAQIALRASPEDPRVNRNFTRASDRLPELRERERVQKILKAAEGKDPGSLIHASTLEARQLLLEAGTYRTNAAERAVALADSLSKRAERLADTWLPVREAIAQAVTNEQQAQTIVLQLEAAEGKTRKAAKELADLGDGAYGAIAEAELDFTRFLKLTAMPPLAIGEDEIAQSNAWQDVTEVNGRAWQQDALDYTRAFRAKFPAWARAYEQQAQSDTNKPPFTAEDQAKISAYATALEKLQLECSEKSLPPKQKEALEVIRKIRELLPKDNSSGQGGAQGQPPPPDPKQDQKPDQNQQQDQQNQQNQQQDPQNPQDGDGEQKPEEKESEAKEEPGEDKQQDEELEAVLKKAQERNDEHEAEKKARMRKAPLPPNERDW